MSKKIKYFFVLAIPIQYFLFSIIENNSNWIEDFYIKHIFKNLTSIFRKFTNLFNFSIGFLILYFIIAYFFYAILICKKNKNINWKNKSLNYAVSFSIGYFIYMILWGLAYYRRPVSEILEINTSNISKPELIELCEYLLIKTNETRSEILTKTAQATEIEKYFQSSIVGYNKLSEENKVFNYKNESIKKVLGSNFLSYLNTAGIYTFWSGEANINTNMLAYEAPFVACHEMAHQLGFASETEANFIAYKACLKNTDLIYHYSAYRQALSYGLKSLWQTDSIKAKLIYNKLNFDAMNDKVVSKNIRLKYNLPIVDSISGYIYDLFLKSNNQNEGIKSYGLMVNLLIGERRKNNYKIVK